MAVVVTNTIPGGGQELYDQVNGKLGFDQGLPEGCQVHIAGPVDEGWRVVTVWDSQDAFESFAQQTLVPTIREVAGDDAPAIQPEVRDAYKVIT
jgi:hypothetical protein